MKRIILEGIDGSGKTSLAEMIKDRLGLPVDEGFKHSGETSYDNWLVNQLVVGQRSKGIVNDRFFYSEVVYGTTLRGRVNISPRLYTMVLDEIRKDALLIYCRPPLDVVIETSQINPQMEGVDENLGRLYDAYEDLMGQESEIYKDRFVLWDFTRHYWINYLNPVIRSYLSW